MKMKIAALFITFASLSNAHAICSGGSPEANNGCADSVSATLGITFSPLLIFTFTTNVATGDVNLKIIAAAKDDAALFVGSNGQIRGAQFQSAVEHLRTIQPELTDSDMQIAYAILNY